MAVDQREPQRTDADEDKQRPKPIVAAADDNNDTGPKRIEEGEQLATDPLVVLVDTNPQASGAACYGSAGAHLTRCNVSLQIRSHQAVQICQKRTVN